MGIAEDFSIFYNRILISTETMGTISSRYKRITRQLNRDFWQSESETNNSLYIGSYGRDTASSGISDLDIGFLLPAKLYQTYNSYTGNGQSALLQAVKTSIQKTYSTSEAFGDGQVVVLNFNDGITFEVLPAFVNTENSWTYPNANAGGSWKVCNPRAEMTAIHDRHVVTNKNLKKLSRISRIWKRYCDVPISGMLIDTLAYQFIESYEHREKSFLYYDWLFRDFFDFLSKRDQNQTTWRAPGSGSYVYRKGIFEHKARSAHLRAVEAISAATNGNEWSSRQKWREIFGTSYPS